MQCRTTISNAQTFERIIVMTEVRWLTFNHGKSFVKPRRSSPGDVDKTFVADRRQFLRGNKTSATGAADQVDRLVLRKLLKIDFLGNLLILDTSLDVRYATTFILAESAHVDQQKRIVLIKQRLEFLDRDLTDLARRIATSPLKETGNQADIA